jgi:hypothetical protein
MPTKKPPSKQLDGHLTAEAEKLIDASVPASTQAHIRDWLKAIAAGERCSSRETAPKSKGVSGPRAVRRRPRRAAPGQNHLNCGM